MKYSIRKLDRALKHLYNVEHVYRAERFLLSELPDVSHTGPGAFLVKEGANAEIHLGIFLNDSIQRNLTDIPRFSSQEWNLSQWNAFAVASEEVSHFNYFLHHRTHGRPVSQLELELQGEIDRFLLAFFLDYSSQKTFELTSKFDRLIEQLFHNFEFRDGLSGSEKSRYKEANQLAENFLVKLQGHFKDPHKIEYVLRTLRRFYRSTLSDKISLACR